MSHLTLRQSVLAVTCGIFACIAAFGCDSSGSKVASAPVVNPPMSSSDNGNGDTTPDIPPRTTGRIALYDSLYAPHVGALHLYEPLTFNGVVDGEGGLCWRGTDEPDSVCDEAHSVARSTADPLTRAIFGDYVFEPPTRNGHVRGNFFKGGAASPPVFLDLASLDRSPGNLFQVDPTTGVVAIEYDQ